ncbi:MAG: GTP-dependent dephospho-CoA kinase family protein [Candidatus Bathyarchaeota archaeon]|nr:GTP-dependent dephospho-CoA kinase family protein [Candidatus Bathyarchaeota archaeon]
MKAEYVLTERLRLFLKEPFGALIEGTPEQTMAKLGVLVAQKKPPKLVSVGDVVTKNLHESGLHPQLSVVDYVSLRNQVMPKEVPVEKTVYVKNPQGTITEEALVAVKLALEGDVHTHIVVEGEEDLLTLAAVLYAPEGSFVVYGQPHVGIVVVSASAEKKEQVKEFLKEMKASKS